MEVEKSARLAVFGGTWGAMGNPCKALTVRALKTTGALAAEVGISTRSLQEKQSAAKIDSLVRSMIRDLWVTTHHRFARHAGQRTAAFFFVGGKWPAGAEKAPARR